MMFRIEYDMFSTLLISDVQETVVETLFDAEMVAVVECGHKLEAASIGLRHCNDLEYEVLLAGAVVGRVKITAINEPVRV